MRPFWPHLTESGHAGAVLSVAFSPPEGEAICIGGANDATIKLWDAESGAELATLKGHTGRGR